VSDFSVDGRRKPPCAAAGNAESDVCGLAGTVKGANGHFRAVRRLKIFESFSKNRVFFQKNRAFILKKPSLYFEK
jgi:hypothetical protein